jgi:hypothetical protein
MKAIELPFYKYMLKYLPNGRYIYKLIEQVITGNNACRFKNFHVDIQGRRMSGEMNTSLGNGFTNLMMFLYLTHINGNKNVDCLIEGDDCLGIFTGPPLTKDNYSKLGFNVKIDYFQYANQASFCGQVYDTQDFIVVADPIKVIMKSGWCSAQYRNSSIKTRRGLLKSKALSILHQYSGCPVLQSFGRYLLRVTSDFHLKIDQSWNNYQRVNFNIEHKILPISNSVRHLLEYSFKLKIDEQLILENYFDNLNHITQLNHPSIYDHCNRDQFITGFHYVLPNIKELPPLLGINPNRVKVGGTILVVEHKNINGKNTTKVTTKTCKENETQGRLRSQKSSSTQKRQWCKNCAKNWRRNSGNSGLIPGLRYRKHDCRQCRQFDRQGPGRRGRQDL